MVRVGQNSGVAFNNNWAQYGGASEQGSGLDLNVDGLDDEKSKSAGEAGAGAGGYDGEGEGGDGVGAEPEVDEPAYYKKTLKEIFQDHEIEAEIRTRETDVLM